MEEENTVDHPTASGVEDTPFAVYSLQQNMAVEIFDLTNDDVGNTTNSLLHISDISQLPHPEITLTSTESHQVRALFYI